MLNFRRGGQFQIFCYNLIGLKHVAKVFFIAFQFFIQNAIDYPYFLGGRVLLVLVNVIVIK